MKQINSLIEYYGKLNEKYSKDDEETIKNMIALAENIKNNSNILSVKEEYIVRKNEMNRYMDILKYLNKGNTGNTCSLCLTNNVTVYFNPCGHTSCEECFKRMNDRIDISQTNIQNAKCAFCRKTVYESKKLFYL